MPRGVLSAQPADESGRHRLLLPDGTVELVEPDHAALLARYSLTEIVRAPQIDFCAAIHLDGPMAGKSGYAVNELGNRVRVALPPRPGGPTMEYEVVTLSVDGRPAELRLLEPSS